ncbi:MAG: hypothetical protein IKU62_04650 [Ruminiclostridium sp.]|nr:hypothetical protein [Ruminiclostridium sp.]
MIRPLLAVTFAALVSRCLWFPALPTLLCLLGLRFGGETGAKCGLFGGILGVILGFSPWYLPLFTLLGGISGTVFHNVSPFWGNCLRAIPILAVTCLLLALGHWLTGEDLAPCLTLAGRDFLRTVLTLPVVYPLCPKRRSP